MPESPDRDRVTTNGHNAYPRGDPNGTRQPREASDELLPQQSLRAGSSRHQGSGECKPGLSIIRWRVENDSRIRDSAHDPEGSSEVVAQRRRTWADSVHPANSRVEELKRPDGGHWLRFSPMNLFATQPTRSGFVHEQVSMVRGPSQSEVALRSSSAGPPAQA